MLCFKDVSVDYGCGDDTVHALTDVSVQLDRSTVLALIGASGCGKSTLLRVGAGLLHPTSGQVTCGGAPLDPRTLRIGFLPQNYGLLAWKTVRENILLAAEIKGIRRDEDAERLDALVDELGLGDLLTRYPHELSGGQQQRVGLARVFFLAPDLLLMDEPFSALDAITREAMQEVFLSLRRKYAVTTLLVTHYVEEALMLADRIAIMRGKPGRIVEVIDNAFVGDTARRGSPAFSAMGQTLREKIAGEGA